MCRADVRKYLKTYYYIDELYLDEIREIKQLNNNLALRLKHFIQSPVSMVILLWSVIETFYSKSCIYDYIIMVSYLDESNSLKVTT